MAAPTITARIASQATATRLKFLHESAHAMALSSPTASAFLESQYDKVTWEQQLEVPDARRREVCGSCGSIMLPGWSGRVAQEPAIPQNRKGKRAGKSHNQGVQAMVYHCKRCGCKTRQTKKPSYTALKRSLKQTRTTPLSPSTPQTDAGTPESEASTSTLIRSPAGGQVSSALTAKSSSKRRAKARKGGLQALLAKSKLEAAANAKQAYGLNLMDLMKND